MVLIEALVKPTELSWLPLLMATLWRSTVVLVTENESLPAPLVRERVPPMLVELLEPKVVDAAAG